MRERGHGAAAHHPRPGRRPGAVRAGRRAVRRPRRGGGARHGPVRASRATRTPPGCAASIPSIAVAARGGCPRSRARRPTRRALPPGCAFAPRCPVALDVCRTDRPPLLEVGPGHGAGLSSERRARGRTLTLDVGGLATMTHRHLDWTIDPALGRPGGRSSTFEGGRTWVRDRRRRGGRAGAPGCAPLLLLHGGPGACHDYLESLAAISATGRRVIFYDQQGCGNSDQPDDPARWTVDFYRARGRRRPDGARPGAAATSWARAGAGCCSWSTSSAGRPGSSRPRSPARRPACRCGSRRPARQRAAAAARGHRGPGAPRGGRDLGRPRVRGGRRRLLRAPPVPGRADARVRASDRSPSWTATRRSTAR